MELDGSVLEKYRSLYAETQGVLPDELERFGDIYGEQGYLTRDQLYDIAYASSTRSAYHVEKNPEDRCEHVTRLVYELDDDFSRIALLEALQGFKAPTASCVVAALDPERHAVVDTRVWASLERFGCVEGRKESFDAADYVTMIGPIRRIAAEFGMLVVDVGYALFALDVDVREGTLH
jgi:thermostable 8-oxoguanine DNA glycosylase